MVYEPQEDSFLLKTFVRKYAEGKVLDMGTGSGIQARTAANSKKVDEVLAVDIDRQALKYAKKYNSHKKITWNHSNLFQKLSSKKYMNFFDTIIFNAPYLPQERKERHIDLEGGRKGHEVIERFLNFVGNYLAIDGNILLVFSSLTPNVKQIIERNLFDCKKLGSARSFFEEIFVYMLKPNAIRKELYKKGISKLNYFTKGKRGWIFTGQLNKKKVAIKIKNPESTASETISHEAKMLKFLNEHDIGPKYVMHTSKFLVYEFVEGKILKEFTDNPKKLSQISKKILDKCFKLDKLNVDKKEMTRPLKHIIIKNSKITFIDFERARKIERPHNVTQFVQFIRNHADEKHKKEWLALSKKYNSERSDRVIQEMKVLLDGKA